MGEEAMVTETQDLQNLPSLDEVFAICGPLLKYVPKICSDLGAETIFEELISAESRNNSIAWTRLFMLAKWCLWQPR